jgi:outer membrane protein assembly factor BamD
MTIDRAPAFRATLAVLLLFALGGCATLSKINPFGGSSAQEEVFDPTSMSAEQLYGRALESMRNGPEKQTVQDFELVDQTYPYSPWAVNAQLMLGFVAYKAQRYTDAIGTLDRFVQLHPSHRDIAYAYYLRALCYYEQISDIQRDQKATQEAIGALTEVVNRFPESSYAKDAKLKIDLAVDHLAGKEMDVGRYYQRQHLYTAAIGRFQKVVDDYQTTNHVAEALHRLTEIYLSLGMVDEARRTAAVLGYNYPGSPWYESSYDDLVKVGQAKPVPTAAAGEGDAAPAETPGFFGKLWNSVF